MEKVEQYQTDKLPCALSNYYENPEGVKDTTITFTKLAKYVLQVYCMPKIMRDVDKPDPMTEDIEKLYEYLSEERGERILAVWNWLGNKDVEKMATDALSEIADEINILLFIAGQIANYQSMTRE